MKLIFKTSKILHVRSHDRKWVHTTFLLLSVIVLNITGVPIYALTDRQIQIFERDIFVLDTDVCETSGGANGLITVTGSDAASSGTWNSGLQAPYILEQFAIELIKNVATKLKVANPQEMVTEEHVVALVAFMWGEGGDIANTSSVFNPLNTGINSPDLLATATDGAGRQSFKSFDAGVEGTARTMVGKNQSRLGYILTQKESTAEQFMEALTYYKNYQGNMFWAAVSTPEYKGDDGIPALGPNAPALYYAQRLSLIKQTRAKYANRAGVVIGTPKKEAILNITAKDKLTFRPTTDTSSLTDAATTTGISDGDSCAPASSLAVINSKAAGSITQTALVLAWEDQHLSDPLESKEEYTVALKKVNPAALTNPVYNKGADCGTFVGAVMRASGVDPNYPTSSTAGQLQYLKDHPELYSLSPATSNTNDWKAGDIFIINNNNGKHHTWIYLGPQANGNDRADAAQGTRMPMRGPALAARDYYVSGGYTRATFIGGGVNNAPTP